MNDNQMILDKLNNSNSNRKKIFLIAGIVASILAVVIICIIALKPGKEESNSKNVSSPAKKYDTTITGDAETDPENTELTDEIGANVDASELVAGKDKTNGIDVSKWQGKIDWQKVKQ